MTSNELSNSLTFPIKLKRIVDTPETDHLIYWDEGGTSFHITDENQFARDIIPNYFKHSNISSFIRQLNMYGFHKVNRIDNGLAIIGTGNDDSQWVHPNFQRDRPELLSGIVRKVTNNAFSNSIIAKKPVPNNSSSEIVPYDTAKGDIARLAKMVQYLKKRDEETSEQLKTLQDENHELYTELMFLREQHEQQTKCIDMLIKFFSRCANKPQSLPSRLKTKRNILALECPQINTVNNMHGSTSEPPRKFLVTKASATGTATATVCNDLYKGKKVIKISNIAPPTQIDINCPKTIPSFTNNPLYQMPSSGNTSNNQSHKTPIIYTLSMPKNGTINNQSKIPNRAITASNTTYLSNVTQKPIYKTVPNQQTVVLQKSNQTSKTVNISTLNVNENLYNNSQHQYYDGNMGDNSFNYNVNQQPQISSRQNVHNESNQNNDGSNTNNIVSGISSSVCNMEQCLNDIKDMFRTDQSPDSDNIGGQFCESDLLDRGVDINDDDDYDFNMLMDNIKSDELLKEMDSSRIHGHELIPFTGSQQDAIIDQNQYGDHQDRYSIDDLLQTPEMSNLSLDYMNDNGYYQRQ